MTAKIYAMVPAMVLAIGTGTALAQPTVSPFAQYDRATLMQHSARLRPYDQENAMVMQSAFPAAGTNVSAQQPFQYNFGGAVAHVGDGSSSSYLKQQQELLSDPGYSIGTGAAHIGTKPSGAIAYQYNFGGAAAHVGDGSSSSYLKQQQELLTEPGYSIGTGAARVSGAW